MMAENLIKRYAASKQEKDTRDGFQHHHRHEAVVSTDSETLDKVALILQKHGYRCAYGFFNDPATRKSGCPVASISISADHETPSTLSLAFAGSTVSWMFDCIEDWWSSRL